MDTPRQRLKEALLRRGETVVGLSQILGKTPGAIHNVASGLSKSRRLQQEITNALQTSEIWPGMTPTEKLLVLPAGTEVESLDPDEAWMQSTLAELSGRVERIDNRTIRFVKATAFTISETPKDEKSSAGAQPKLSSPLRRRRDNF